MHRFCNCGRWGLHAPCLAWLRRLLPALLLAFAVPALADSPPPDCARLSLSRSEDPAAGTLRAMGHEVEAEWVADLLVCVGAGGSTSFGGGTLFIDLEAVGAAKDLMPQAEAGAPAPVSLLAEKLPPWIFGAGALIVLALFALGVAALLLAHKIRSDAHLLIILAVLAFPTLAAAQPLPGVGWQPAAGEIRYGFAQAPSCTTPRRLAPQHDPFAVAGDPMALRDLDLSVPAVRRAYGLRYGATTAELDAGVECWRGGMNGAPHGVGAKHRLEEAFAAGKLGAAGQWTGTANLREIEDVTNSGGEWCRLLAMVGLTCAAAGGPADGWHRGPLLDLPMEWRPPNLRGAPKLYRGTAPADGCAWVSAHARLSPPKPPDLYVVNRQACFAGLPADCQSVATLKPECWSAPAPGPVCGDGTCEPPGGPGSCPADCPPEPPAAALDVLDCDHSGWRVVIRGIGERRVFLGAEVSIDGVLVRLPAACAGECPAAELLDRVCREVRGEPVSIRQDCLECHPIYGCGGHPSCPRERKV